MGSKAIILKKKKKKKKPFKIQQTIAKYFIKFKT